MRGRTAGGVTVLLAFLAVSLASGQQLAFPITDKITGLAGK